MLIRYAKNAAKKTLNNVRRFANAPTRCGTCAKVRAATAKVLGLQQKK
jgi:hypothetical protein